MNAPSTKAPLVEVTEANASAPRAAQRPQPSLELLRDVEVEVTLEIGRKRMRIGDLLKLGTGQTLELDKSAGEPLEIMVNGRVIGRGEAVVVGDRYALRITEIVAPKPEETK